MTVVRSSRRFPYPHSCQDMPVSPLLWTMGQAQLEVRGAEYTEVSTVRVASSLVPLYRAVRLPSCQASSHSSVEAPTWNQVVLRSIMGCGLSQAPGPGFCHRAHGIDDL